MLGGDSAGGNFAAVVSMLARDRVDSHLVPLPAEAARLKVVYEGHHAAARWAEKLEALKALVATLPP